MQIKKAMVVATLAATAMCAARAAVSGPAVTVTFKNLGTQPATYTPVTNNEVSTYADARPAPKKIVDPGDSNSYRVQNQISPDANAAVVRYTMGSKTCVFGTTFVYAIGGGSLITGGLTKIPKWNKTATGIGGADCNATFTLQNPVTHEWSVEFTMR